MNRETLQNQIKEDLPSAQSLLCLLILDDLLFGDWNLDRISIANLCFWSEDKKEIFKILPYITGDRTHLLDLKMYFQDGETSYELNNTWMKEVVKGNICHPVTNELLDYVEASKKVFMYFVASDLIRGLRV